MPTDWRNTNMLAIDLMNDAETPRRLKRKLPQVSMCHWTYTLQDFYKLSNVLLNVTRSDSL